MSQTSQPAYAPALNFLNADTEVNTEYLARKIIVNVQAGNDATALINELLIHQNLDGGFGDQPGDDSSVFDTAFALEALGTAHYSSNPFVGAAVGYLLNHQNANGGWDVIGGRKIIANNSTVLPTGLPYYPGVKVRGATYGALPSALQNTMTLAFGLDPLGEPINPVTFPWPKLNNHKVTLSFKPATAADEQALVSLLPSEPITDPSQLPSSIPAYLINVIPELAVDGSVVGQGYAMRLGEDLNFYYGIERVGGIGNQTYTYPVVAGSYESVMVGGGERFISNIQ